WTRQFMMLNENLLLFYKSDTHTSPSEIISLSSIKNVTRTEEKEFCFKIECSSRGDMYISCKTETDMYAWMDEIYKRANRVGISKISNVKRNVHVGFDEASGEFTNLPKQWQDILIGSKLTKEDMQKDPQAVLDVLNYY
ncbi:PH-domain-containing protein, partial [Rozella allomycis CSF55]